MSWRRFRILLAGLSGQSRIACSLREKSDGPERLNDEATDAWALAFPKVGE